MLESTSMIAPRRITPYLALNRTVLESNLREIMTFCQVAGLRLRPHFKAHKMVEIAAMQLALGANGISTATIGEARGLIAAGLRRGLLITSELCGAPRLVLLNQLLTTGAELAVCVESEAGITDLVPLARHLGLRVLIDVDIGSDRTGARSDEILRLVDRVIAANLVFSGLQTYNGRPSRTYDLVKRRSEVLAGWDIARDVVERLIRAGQQPEIVTGGNTATFEFDVEAGVVNELQLGGYAVGDEDYAALERSETVLLPNGRTIPNPARCLENALRVISTVVGRRDSGTIIVDAGLKAFATDRPAPPVLQGATGASYAFEGDEYGRVDFADPRDAPVRGSQVEFSIQHCDPTVNLYSEVEVFDLATESTYAWVGTWKVIARHPHARTEESRHANTLALHAGYAPSTGVPARAVPIFTTVAYRLRDWEHGVRLLSLEEEGHTYSRISNPTVAVLEERMAQLEGGGAGVAFASGAAATSAVFLALCRHGDNIVATSTMYGGTADVLRHSLRHLGIEARFVPVDELDKLERRIDLRTRLVFTESLGNPRLDIPDFANLSAITRRHKVPLVVDNTVLTPALLSVRDVGGDVAVYSASKFLGGHGNAIGGVIVDLGTFDWAASDNPVFKEIDPSYNRRMGTDFGERALAVRLRATVLRNLGACLGPFEAWCILQGIETLSIRMERHSRNALTVARFLEDHERVNYVIYTGLPQHSHYMRCQRYCDGMASGLLFFGVAGGIEQAKQVLSRCRVVSHVTQLGDSRSCIQHPATTSHSQVPADECARAGLAPEMLRLSVGLEDVDDILADLDQALRG